MQLNAGLDPIIAIVIAVGWFVIQALVNRRREAESWDELETPPAPRPHVPEQNQGAPPTRIPQPGPKSTTPPLRPVILTPQRPAAQPPLRPAQPPPFVATTAPAPTQTVIVREAEAPAETELSKLKESHQSYARAAGLQQAVQQRLSAINQQTTTHKPTAPKTRRRPAATVNMLRTFRNPTTLRQAFLASFVINPPKSLE
jgi:hypothetical protein